MIVSVHIHKNAGLNFKKFLLKSYGKKILFEYGKDRSVLDRFFSGGNVDLPVQHNYNRYDIVHGHFLANRFDSFTDIELVTFLREPAQRLVSNYFFLKRNFYDHSPICHLIRDGLTLEQYIELESSQNTQSFFLGNKSIDDFKFVGIVEEYEKSVLLFKKVMQVKFNIVHYAFYYFQYFKYALRRNRSKVVLPEHLTSNKNSEKNSREYEIPPILLERIKSINKADYELYENAKNRFARLRKMYGI